MLNANRLRSTTVHRLVALSIALLSTASALPAAAETRWSITDLGAGFIPVDINNRGDILRDQLTIDGKVYGGVRMNNLGQTILRNSSQSYLYDSGRLTHLDPFGLSDASDINDKGQISGMTCSGMYCGGNPAILTSGKLDVLVRSNAWYFNTMSMNESGAVLGLYGGERAEVAVLIENHRMIPMGLDGDHSLGSAVNDIGHVAGTAETNWNFSQHAFLYRNGHSLDLGTLGGMYSRAFDLNNSD